MILVNLDSRVIAHLTAGLLPTCAALAASVLVFRSVGPILVACLASAALILRCTGVRYFTGGVVPVSSAGISRFGRWTIVHSHHCPRQRNAAHEFRFGEKYFCAGCSGLALGTLVSLMIPVAYLLHALDDHTLSTLLILAPVCFLPTVVRCIAPDEIRAHWRFVAYGLLPIGSWIFIIGVETRYQSWQLNVLTLLVIVFSWNIGGLYLRTLYRDKCKSKTACTGEQSETNKIKY